MNLSIIFIIVIALIIILFIYLISQYNSLVKLNNTTKEAFSTMDVYLKKRWELLPNLVEVVKGYEKYEKASFEQITNIRTKSYNNIPLEQKINVNEQLEKDISKIMAIVENYPELKASENFYQLNIELSKIEDEIANSRKYYNGCVRELNTKIQMFPSNIVAHIFKFKQLNMFEANESERNSVKVNL